jgi:WD40 repeat protein
MPQFSDHQQKSGYSFVAAIDDYDGANEFGSQVYGDQLKSFDGQEISLGVERFIEHVLRNGACRYRPPDPRFCHLGRSLSCHELENSLEDFLSIEEHTECLIYLSGHGVECREDQQSKGYFAASDTRLIYHNQELVKVEQGLSFDGLETILTNAYGRRGDRSQLKSLLLIIDSCHSGHAISGDRLLSKLQLMYQDARWRPYQDAFSYGVLTSSLGYQQGYVDSEMGLSVFTKALTDTLCKQDNGPITFEELAFRLAGGDIAGSVNRQVSKTAHAGRLVVMAYPGLTTPKKPEPDKYGTPINPYQGLKPFNADSARFFYGRQDVVADLLEKLEQQDRGLLLLAGASGSGKSSVAKAGLLPRLNTTKGYAYHELVSFGLSPRARLRDALNTLLEKELAVDEYKNVLSLLPKVLTPKSLEKLTSALPQTKNLVLYIDQLEEALLPLSSTESTPGHPKHQKELDRFLNLLAAARKPLQIIASIRSDFLDVCLQNEHLHRLIQYGNCVYYMPPLAGADLREAITAPAVEQGWEIAPSLVKQLESEVGREVGSLPLLSFALAKLWDYAIQRTETGDHRHEVKTTITLKDYKSLGKGGLILHVDGRDHLEPPAKDIDEFSGLQSILNNYADIVFTFADWKSSDLPPEHPRSEKTRQWIEQIFLQLIRPSDDTKDTSKPCLRRDLLFTLECASETEAITTPTKEDLNELLDQLVESRLLTEDVVSGKSEIRLAHEALIDGWALFRGWRSSHRDLLRLREQLQQQRRLWEESGRDDGYLLSKGLVSQITDAPLEKLRPLLPRSEDRKFPDEEYYLLSKEHLERQETALRNALAEARLRLLAHDAESKFEGGEYDKALELTLGLVAQNLEHLPGCLLGPIQKLLLQSAGLEKGLSANKRIDGGHTGHITSLAFSADGQMIASSGEDGTIHFWSVDGTHLRTLTVSDLAVASLAFSVDGQILASGGDQGSLQLWSMDGIHMCTLEGHQGTVYSVAFSPDGQKFASAGDDGIIRLWSLDGTLLQTLQESSARICSVAFSADGKTLASACEEETILLWRLDDGAQTHSLKGHIGSVLSVAFSTDGQTLVSGGVDGTLRLWGPKGDLLRIIKGHEGAVLSVAFRSDGKAIVSAGQDCSIRLYSLDGKMLDTFEGPSRETTALCFSRDGQTLAAAGADLKVWLWSVDGKHLRTLDGHRGMVMSLVFSPAGNSLASAGYDGSIRLWSMNGRPQVTFNAHRDHVECLAINPVGDILASCSMDGNCRMWSLDGKILHEFRGFPGWARALAFSPDGQILATGGEKGLLVMYGLNGAELRRFNSPQPSIRSVAFNPHGQTLASASADGTIMIWGLDGNPITTLRGHKGTVFSVAFNHRREVLASAGEDGNVLLWRPEWTSFRTFEGHNDGALFLGFSANGQALASAGMNGTIQLRNQNGLPLASLNGLASSPRDVSLSPDLQTVAIIDEDGRIQLIDIDGTNKRTFNSYMSRASSVAFSIDGRIVASGYDDGTVILWGLDGEQLLHIRHGSIGIWLVAFSPDGETLATACRDAVRLWKIDGKPLHTTDVSSAPLTLSFSPDGQMFAFAGYSEYISIFNLDGTPLGKLPGYKGEKVMSVAFGTDGHSLASAGHGGVQMWKLDGTHLCTLNDHNGPVSSVAFSPDGKTLASIGLDGDIRLWKTDWCTWRTLDGHNGAVATVAFSHDGSILASGGDQGSLKLWNSDGTPLRTLVGHTGVVWSVEFSPAGHILASASGDGGIRLWNLDFPTVQALECAEGVQWLCPLAFCADGHSLASVSLDGAIILWNRDGTQLRKIEGPREIAALAFSTDGQTFATAGHDGNVQLWTLGGTLLRTFQGSNNGPLVFSEDGQMLIGYAYYGSIVNQWKLDGTIASTTFSPAGNRNAHPVALADYGKLLACVADQGNILLFRLDGSCLTCFMANHDISSVALCDDAKVIATGDVYGAIRLWSWDGTLLLTLEGHKDSICSLAFSADGQTLASVGDDGIINLWPDATWKSWLGHALHHFEQESGWQSDKLGWTASLSLRERALNLLNRSASLEDIQLALFYSRWSILCKRGDLFAPAQSISLKDIERRSMAMLAPMLEDKGLALTREGKEVEAIAMIRRASELGIPLDTIRQPQSLAGSIHSCRGVVSALQGNIASAVKHFRNAIRFGVVLDNEPEPEAKRLALLGITDGINAIIQKGQTISIQEVTKALEQLAKARGINPAFDLDRCDWHLLLRSGSLAVRGNPTQCKALLSAASPSLTHSENPLHRETLAIARILAGGKRNAAAALRDLKFCLTKVTSEQNRERLACWVSQLEAGENPLTEQEIEELLTQ